MALMECPECGRQVSDKAISCPGCGFPIREYIAEQENYGDDTDLSQVQMQHIENVMKLEAAEDILHNSINDHLSSVVISVILGAIGLLLLIVGVLFIDKLAMLSMVGLLLLIFALNIWLSRNDKPNDKS